MSKIVTIRDGYQQYQYTRTQPVGKQFDADFKPDLTPQDMLALGVFGGVYMSDKPKEFPAKWFAQARLSSDGVPHKELNHFGVLASQPLAEWRRKGWISEHDPRGWFQWYCRYYQGRRISEEDERQIKRWRAMRRHIAQLERHCEQGDVTCRPRQRQALLQWAYDSRTI